MKKNIFIVMCVLACGSRLVAQEALEQSGTRDFNDYNYYAAITKLEKVDQKDISSWRRLAEAYDRIGDYSKAEQTYATICSTIQRIPNDHLNYARVLMKNEKYTEAEKQLKLFAQLNPQDEEAARMELLNTHLEEAKIKALPVKLELLGFNSEAQDFCPVLFENTVYFASTRDQKGMSKRLWVGNQLPFLDVYTIALNNNSWGTPNELQEKKMNSKYHEGPISFSADGKEMFITRNNYEQVDAAGVRHFQLYTATKNGSAWSEPQLLPFNSNEFSVGHAALSPDGNTLFFVSDMPGGKGGTDIYVSKRSNGNWTVPENLSSINTIGDEMFPYVHSSGILFFSSNGWSGYGGLDVFLGEWKNGKLSQVRNAGAPFNSSADDFGVFLQQDGLNGWLSSNRKGGKGNDDIYGFQLSETISFGRKINVLVVDQNKAPLPNTTIQFTLNGITRELMTDENGKFAETIDELGTVVVSGQPKDYFPGKKQFEISEQTPQEITQQLVLEKDPGFQLLIKVADKKSKAVVDSVRVLVTNNFTGATDTVYTVNGQSLRPIYNKKMGERISYSLRLEKQGYISKDFTYNRELNKAGVYDVAQEMNLTLEKMDIGVDLAKAIDLKPIYFDVGMFNIRPDAAVELDKIVKVMNEYPTMVVELGSHTDCRGTAAKNLDLSDKRAKASAEYIRAKIVNPERIYGKGYGETLILNGCKCEGSNQKKYTEAQHGVNRRTEFVVKKI